MLGNADTIWIQLSDGLVNVEGAFFKIIYDDNHITPIEIIDGPDTPSGSFASCTVHPDDSVLINIGILDGDFDGPGSILGIVFDAHTATTGTELDFSRAVVRGPENQDYTFSTSGATIVIQEFVCGDVNSSGEVDIDDAVYIIAYIFDEGPEPQPYESGNVDCSIDVDIDDVVYLIQYIFGGGNAPCDPSGDGVPDC
jgi:hypothetical protein